MCEKRVEMVKLLKTRSQEEKRIKNGAYRMISRLQSFESSSFWGFSSKFDRVSKLIRKALFIEANIYWRNLPMSDFHGIYSTWEFRKFPRIYHSRLSNSMYHSMVLGRARLNNFLFR